MSDAAPALLTLTDDLDVFGVAKRWEELLQAVRQAEGDLIVDLAAVGDLDVSGMQLLLTVQATLAQRGSTATFRGLRPDFQQRLSDLGLVLTLEETRP